MSKELKNLLASLAGWKASQYKARAEAHKHLAAICPAQFEASIDANVKLAIHYSRAWQLQMRAAKRLRGATVC